MNFGDGICMENHESFGKLDCNYQSNVLTNLCIPRCKRPALEPLTLLSVRVTDLKDGRTSRISSHSDFGVNLFDPARWGWWA